MSQVNYKLKYEQLKAKYMNSVDTAWRLGYEQGLKDAQADAAMQSQEQQAQMTQQGQPGEDGQEQDSNQPDQQEQPQGPASANPNGSELDQHIAQLEGMLGKSESNEELHNDLKKAISDLKLSQQMAQINRSMKPMSSSKKPVRTVRKFTLSENAIHNTTANAKKTLTTQEKIISEMMKSWAEEDQKATSNILSTLGIKTST